MVASKQDTAAAVVVAVVTMTQIRTLKTTHPKVEAAVAALVSPMEMVALVAPDPLVREIMVEMDLMDLKLAAETAAAVVMVAVPKVELVVMVALLVTTLAMVVVVVEMFVMAVVEVVVPMVLLSGKQVLEVSL